MSKNKDIVTEIAPVPRVYKGIRFQVLEPGANTYTQNTKK